MSKYKPVFFDIETTGFNPMTPAWYSDSIEAEVTAVAIGELTDWSGDAKDKKVDVLLNRGNGEYSLIEETRQRLERIGERYRDKGWEPFLVGHNIIQFDCLYWAARASRYRQDSWPIGYGWRRLDSLRALSIPADEPEGPKTYPGQQEYADYLGLSYVDELDGSDMPQAFVDGDYEMIGTHVEDDVSTLIDIFIEEREDMVDYLWDHYGNHDRQPLDENRPVFNDEVEISIDRAGEDGH